MRRCLVVPAPALGFVVVVVAVAVTLGCASQGVPLQKGYLDSGRPVFELVLVALHDIGAEVVAQSPQRDFVTAHLDADTSGMDVLLEVRLDHRLADVTYVSVTAWSEVEELSREDQDLWRERFFEALDALAGGAVQRGAPGSGERPPRYPD